MQGDGGDESVVSTMDLGEPSGPGDPMAGAALWPDDPVSPAQGTQERPARSSRTLRRQDHDDESVTDDGVVDGLAATGERSSEANAGSADDAAVPAWRGTDPGLVVVLVGVACFAVVFGRLGWNHHRNFGTWSFDMAIYDQATWLFATGKEPFITVRGLHAWGHHVNPILYLFAPLYWLGAGPGTLYVVQAAVMSLGAIPLYLLARDVLASRLVATVVAFSFLMYPAVQWICWANFHPEALAVTPMLFAWWYAHRQRWRAFFVALLLALATREEAGLVVAAMGVVLAYRWLPWRASVPAAGRRSGFRAALGTIALGAFWFMASTRLVIPRFNAGAGPFYVQYFFGQWGSTIPEVLWNMGSQPSKVVSVATQTDRIRYYRDLFLPLAGMPFLAPLTMLPAAPQLLINVTGGSPYARQIFYQYNALLVAPVFMALVDGLARFRKWPSVLRKLALVLAVTTIVSNQAWSPSPGSERYRAYWARPEPRHETLRAAVAIVPDGVGVAATYQLLPHLAHRKYAYDWPNPWRLAYWGNNNENPPDPNNVQYLVIDRRLVGDEDKATVDTLTAPGGEFRVLLDQDDVLVAERVRKR